MKNILKVLGTVVLVLLFVWWIFFYYSNCVFSGDTLANMPAWCIAFR